MYKFYFDYKYKGKIYHNIGYHRNAQIYSINDSLDVFIKQNPQISKAGSLEFRKRNPLWLLGLLLLVLIGIFIIYRSEKSNLFLISLLNNGYITIGKYVSHSYESNSECERFVYSYYDMNNDIHYVSEVKSDSQIIFEVDILFHVDDPEKAIVFNSEFSNDVSDKIVDVARKYATEIVL